MRGSGDLGIWGDSDTGALTKGEDMLLPVDFDERLLDCHWPRRKLKETKNKMVFLASHVVHNCCASCLH